jgi:hypothetical protein
MRHNGPMRRHHLALFLFTRNIGLMIEQSSCRGDEPLPQQGVSACRGFTITGKATEEAMLKKLQAKRMVWSNESRISSRIILANFLRSMGRHS